jgi:hypothetical protein
MSLLPTDSIDRRNVALDAAAHNLFKGQILDVIEAKMAATEAAAQAAVAAPTPEQEPADATTPASASASTSATEHIHRADHDEFIVIDGPTSTQDAPSASPYDNPFF